MLKASVVIPTRNRSNLLEKTIEHIESQTVSRDLYEVIVVDNDSNDSTCSLLKQKSRKYSNLRCSLQKQPGAAATRNAGLRMAKGEVTVFIDDDVHAEPSLIEKHLDQHRNDTHASVMGAVTIPWGDTTEPFRRYLRDHRIFNPYTPANGAIDFSYYHTCNASTPTSALVRLGGFSEAFTMYGMEDIELGYRLEKAGFRMIFAPDAKAVHHRFPCHGEFLEQCQHSGYSLGLLLSFHPELKSHFVERGRFTRHLKKFDRSLATVESLASPLITVLTNWEKHRGTGRIDRLLDLYYSCSIRYHIFLGYRRYLNESRRQGEPAYEKSLSMETDKAEAVRTGTD